MGTERVDPWNFFSGMDCFFFSPVSSSLLQIPSDFIFLFFEGKNFKVECGGENQVKVSFIFF